MRIAYADPPYIGCANKYTEKQEVDHRKLLLELQQYDGWALSASSPSLKVLVPLCNEICPDYRIGSWVKPFCAFKVNVNPAFAWEPVIFKSARARGRTKDTVRDWVSANITLEKGLVGAKPAKFCMWLFDILGMEFGDELIDLFPGTGIVTQCWNSYKSTQQVLL